MTATITAPAPAPAPPKRRPKRGPRRWHRIAIPLGLVALFWAASLGAHAYQQPNITDAGTLSPTGTGRHGSSELARRLAAAGVEVVRVSTSQAALDAARGRDATIFVPAADLLRPGLLNDLIGQAGLAHVVLVRPGLLGRVLFGAPFGVSQRWATATAGGEACADPRLPRFGAVAVERDRYIDDPGCYGGSVVEYRAIDVRVTLVGATEPFRNDRIDQADNAAFATALLGEHPRVVWLDVHRNEVQFALPNIEIPDYQRRDPNRTNTGEPLMDSFPALLWAGLVLLLGTALLLALARARRLGPPVPEPLPVVVPAAEAVLGRGRLYRRIRARGASLTALRSAAIARIARVLDPVAGTPEPAVATPGPARDAFVQRTAARAGLAPATVEGILFGPEPDDDAALVRATAELDQLVTAITGPAGGTPPNQSGGAS